MSLPYPPDSSVVLMDGGKKRTFVRVGEIKEAPRYGLWVWDDIKNILGQECCEDGTCGYVKSCIK